MRVVQALFFHPLCATAYSSAPLCSLCHCFILIELTVQALWQGKMELLSSSLLSFFFACTPSSVWRYIKQDIFAINSVVATGLTQQTLHLGGCDTPLKCWVDSSAKLSGCVWKLIELWNTAAKAFCVPSSVSPPFLPTANKLYWQTKAGLWWGDLQDNRIMEAKTSKHCDYVRGWAGWSCRRKGTTQKQ